MIDASRPDDANYNKLTASGAGPFCQVIVFLGLVVFRRLVRFQLANSPLSLALCLPATGPALATGGPLGKLEAGQPLDGDSSLILVAAWNACHEPSQQHQRPALVPGHGPGLAPFPRDAL